MINDHETDASEVQFKLNYVSVRPYLIKTISMLDLDCINPWKTIYICKAVNYVIFKLNAIEHINFINNF